MAPDPITRALETLHQRFAADTRGAVATYIPQLATADPERFGIAIASLAGRIYQAGDAELPFTIQSVSKPFVYALALADLGSAAVLARVGAEPSGEAFNAISLEPQTGRPANPMINAGAIVTTSLVDAPNKHDRFERIRLTLSAFAGRPLDVDEAVYASERETGDTNRALAYLMRGAGSLRADVDETLDVYFRQCALLVTARDVAVMAATLANGGVNRVTGKAVVSNQVARQVMAVMATCGMYDASGEWLLRVGLPAKSGVSGALIAVSPAQFGIGVFSPRLDAQGNSVRAIEACRELADRFDLHLMHQPGSPAPVFYLEETGATMHSTKPRGDRERAALSAHGQAIVIRGLQGDIEFAEAEIVLSAFGARKASAGQSARWLVVDLHRVGRLHRVAREILQASLAEQSALGVAVVVADAGRRGLLAGFTEFSSLDDALQWCEDELLSVAPLGTPE